MITAHDTDEFVPEDGPEKRLTTWYAQGHSDGLGDRLLMFDNTSAPSWEILRFKRTLAGDARFEAAVRQRVERLSTFHHPAFPLVRPIEALGQEDGLAVVSTYVAGAPLADALSKPRSVAFAIRLIRQLAPALEALQQHAPGIAHGALTGDRIVLGPEGRLMIREHMVGSALESLELPTARLWSDYNILAPPTRAATPPLDQRSDVMQLALVALSLMVGRRIGPDEYPARVPELLDEIARRQLAHGSLLFQSLRSWLERALQLSDRSFDSARQANDSLTELQEGSDRGPDHFEEKLLPSAKDPTPPAIEEPPPAMWSAARRLPARERERLLDRERVHHSEETSPSDPAVPVWQRIPKVIQWAALGVAVFAIGEAIVIGYLLFGQSRAQPAAETAPSFASSAPPAVAPPSSPPPAAEPVALVSASARVDPPLPEIRTAPLPAVPVRSGGFRVSSSIPLYVLDGERVIGASADGPIMATAGRHEFDFVNSVIGYRTRRVVDIKPGQIAALNVAVPNGNLNINAQPWASVWIDGNPVGETPLGNLSVLPGEHEIVFRHPQLGERRERTIVRPDVETRVAVSLQR
jgi:hypothetical protein